MYRHKETNPPRKRKRMKQTDVCQEDERANHLVEQENLSTKVNEEGEDEEAAEEDGGANARSKSFVRVVQRLPLLS